MGLLLGDHLHHVGEFAANLHVGLSANAHENLCGRFERQRRARHARGVEVVEVEAGELEGLMLYSGAVYAGVDHVFLIPSHCQAVEVCDHRLGAAVGVGHGHQVVGSVGNVGISVGDASGVEGVGLQRLFYLVARYVA